MNKRENTLPWVEKIIGLAINEYWTPNERLGMIKQYAETENKLWNERIQAHIKNIREWEEENLGETDKFINFVNQKLMKDAVLGETAKKKKVKKRGLQKTTTPRGHSS